MFVWEEHIPCDHPLPYLEHHPFPEPTSVVALRPRLPHWWSREEVERGLKQLLDQFAATCLHAEPLLWFYTPVMFALCRASRCRGGDL